MSSFVLENVSQQKDKHENNLLYLLALWQYYLIKKLDNINQIMYTTYKATRVHK